jgi:hypothetical protein
VLTDAEFIELLYKVRANPEINVTPLLSLPFDNLKISLYIIGLFYRTGNKAVAPLYGIRFATGCIF